MGKVPVKRPPRKGRGERSMKNARITLDSQRRAQGENCRHTVFRFRKSSTEQVCSLCGAVRVVKRDDQFGVAVLQDWTAVSLIEEAIDHYDSNDHD